MTEHDRHRRGDVEHVDGAPSPDLVVYEFSAEGIVVPAIRVDRHHIRVSHQAQTLGIWVGAVDASHERHPSRGRLEALGLHSAAVEEAFQRIGISDFLTRVGLPSVDARVSDEGLEQVDGFGRESIRVGRVC